MPKHENCIRENAKIAPDAKKDPEGVGKMWYSISNVCCGPEEI